MTFTAPQIDYAGLSPIITLTAGVVIVLMVGLLPRAGRWTCSVLTLGVLGTAAGLAIWQWGEHTDLVAGTLRLDELGLAALLIALFAAAVTVILSVREPAAEGAGHGAFYALLLGSVLGMAILSMSQNLVSFFIGLELLSIPLYVLCGSAVRREASLEAGLKYLIIGSVGSATLLYGFALIYGTAGSTDYNEIAQGIRNGGLADDTLILIGTAMAATGLAFKISIAPFHQWTPDVYQGAPTPVTSFMAVATKTVAFIASIRLFELALGPVEASWDGALAVLAVISIAVGNIGALGQDSIKRLLGYSGIAQAGYILSGLVVFDEFGVEAIIFYLAAYALMNLAVFVPLVARERETPFADDIRSVEGLGGSRPLLAWPMTIGLLGLAGIPGTVGFMGKLFLIEAAVGGHFTWIGVAIVVGSMVSLAYYLRVIAAIWMRPEPAGAGAPAIAGASPEAPESNSAPGSTHGGDSSASRPGSTHGGDSSASRPGSPGGSRCWLIVGVGMLCAAATIFFGIDPSPLVDWAANAGQSFDPFAG